MTITFSKKLLSALILLSCAAMLAGCNGANQRAAGPKPSAEDIRVAELIRARTDDFVLALAAGDMAKIRSFYPPEASFDIRQQVFRLLEVPPKSPFQVTQWDANVDVAIAPDRLRAQILPIVQVKVGSTQPAYRQIALTWVSSDKTWQTFYLEPLK